MKSVLKITFWSFLILLLLGNTAIADIVPTLSAPAVTSHTDLSMTTLGMIFGHVGASVQGVSGSLLGIVIYRFNEGVVIVASILLSYTSVLTMFRAGNDTLMLSLNRPTATLVMRMAIGVGLLLPLPQSNYNAMQLVLMKVVKESVVLADMTWDYALDYLGNGGELFQEPVKSTESPEYVAATDSDYLKSIRGSLDSSSASSPLSAANNAKLGLVQKMFVDSVCMYQSQLTPSSDATSSTDNTAIYNDDQAPNLEPFIQVASDGSKTLIYPSSKDDKTGVTCGNISVASYFSNMGSDIAKSNDAAHIKSTVVPDLLLDTAQFVAPAAKSYVCTRSENKKTSFCQGSSYVNVADAENRAAEALFQAYQEMTAGVLLLQKEATVPAGTKDLKTSFISKAKSDGWAMAGSYYWNLAVFTSQMSAASAPTQLIADSAVIFPDFVGQSSDPCSNPNNEMQKAVCGIGSSGQFLFNMTADLNSSVANYAKKIASSQSSGLAESAGGGGASTEKVQSDIQSAVLPIAAVSLTSAPVVYQILSAITHLINIFLTFSGDPGTNPLVFLNKVGLQCFGAGSDILLGSMVAVLVASLLTVICKGQVDLSVPGKVFAAWIRPLVLTSGGMFLFAGAFMIFFPPIFPYAVFTLAFFGWIIMVIEAVVAMPLVALGLTHPDGHVLLGRAEQSSMLLISTFLRPVLMVMGLVIAIILSFVAYKMVIYLFGSLLQGLFQQSAPSTLSTQHNAVYDGLVAQFNTSSASSGYGWLMEKILVAPVIFIIFCSIVYTVTTKCYMMVVMLPDAIMAWIGVPKQPDQSVEASMGELERLSSSGMSSMSSVSSTGAKSMKDPDNQVQRPDSLQGKKES